MMASRTDRLPCGILVVLAIVSSISAGGSTDNTNDTNVYDDACFVPSSERPRDENKLVLFELSLPVIDSWNQLTQHLIFPSGSCGVDVYILIPFLYFDHELKEIIQYEANQIPDLCTYVYTDTNATAKTDPWHLQVISTGHGSSDHQSEVLVPLEEVARIPSEWLEHLVVHMYTDFLVAGHQDLLCTLTYLNALPDTVYNLNFTFEINGCPSGKYGSYCNQSCSCAEGVECHSFNGVCMCPTGLGGLHCDQRQPQLTVDDQQVYVVYGETFVLTCTSDGMIPSACSWSRDNDDEQQPTTVLDTSYREVNVAYSPRPTVVSAELTAQSTSVNGVYVCKVHDENNIVYTQRVSVAVIAVPDPFIQVPQNHTALKGSNATFSCKIRADAGTVRWVKGHNQPFDEMADITDQMGRYEVSQLSEGVSQLRIIGVEFEDEDVYRCFVGYVFRAPDLNVADAMLVVQSDPEPECSFQGIINVQAGEKLTLHCSLKQAKPLPILTWDIKGRGAIPQPETTTVSSDDNHSWDLNTFLTFVPVVGDDGKLVSLSVWSPASNGFRRVRASLNVTYKPIVTITPDPVTLIQDQDDVTIRCSAQANPPPISYSWTLKHPSNASQAVVGIGFTYTIEKVSEEYDNSSLTCQVTNAVGESDMTVLIKVTAPSSAVTVGFSVLGGVFIVVLVLASCLTHQFRKEINLWWAKKSGKNNDDKKYDVFISYKSGGLDEAFVVGSLIPRLERDGYRICVHYKSFLPGKSIIDNIADAVHLSRKTLLLLSPGFIESEWCRYEFQAALSQMLHLRTDLIPIIFEDLGPMEDLSSDLQTILRMLSYVTWPKSSNNNGSSQNSGPENEEERFWKLLWQTLPDTPLERELQVADNINLAGGEGDMFKVGSGREELITQTPLEMEEHVHTDENAV